MVITCPGNSFGHLLSNPRFVARRIHLFSSQEGKMFPTPSADSGHAFREIGRNQHFQETSFPFPEISLVTDMPRPRPQVLLKSKLWPLPSKQEKEPPPWNSPQPLLPPPTTSGLQEPEVLCHTPLINSEFENQGHFSALDHSSVLRALGCSPQLLTPYA